MVTSQPSDVPVIQSAAVAPPKDTPTSSNHNNNNSPIQEQTNQGMFHGLPRQAWRQQESIFIYFICVTGFIHQKDLILTIALKKKRKKSKKHMSMHI
jgi:hypothetical protein